MYIIKWKHKHVYICPQKTTKWATPNNRGWDDHRCTRRVSIILSFYVIVWVHYGKLWIIIYPPDLLVMICSEYFLYILNNSLIHSTGTTKQKIKVGGSLIYIGEYYLQTTGTHYICKIVHIRKEDNYILTCQCIT
jgi:hypothetical protein